MTRVLVAYASTVGGTKEIAEAVGQQMRQGGIDATVCDAGDVGSIDSYDAAVVGSGVYMSQWGSESVHLLERLADSGKQRPTWIFQSGPSEASNHPTGYPVPKRVRRLAADLGAPPVTTFGGRIESATAPGVIARRIAAGPTAGDYREFTGIRRWAAGIVGEIETPKASAD